MWKNKHALFTGLTLFGVFCLTRGLALLLERISPQLATPVYAALEVLIFLAAVVALWRGTKDEPPRLRLSRFSIKNTGCILFFGAAAAFAAQCVNALAYRGSGLGALPVDLPLPVSGAGAAGALVMIVLPSVAEELFLRGAVLSSLEKSHNTGVALVLIGVFQAMLVSSREYLLGGFLLGWALAYLTYAFGSVWAAVVARMVYQLVSILCQWMGETYGVFGIWNYGLVLCLIGTLLFGYLALRSLHKQLLAGRVRTFQKGVERVAAALLQTFLSPGMVALLLAFATKTLFMIW